MKLNMKEKKILYAYGSVSYTHLNPACLQSVLTAAIPFQPSKIKVEHLLPERKSVMDNKIEVFKNEQFGEAVSYTHLDVYKRQG